MINGVFILESLPARDKHQHERPILEQLFNMLGVEHDSFLAHGNVSTLDALKYLFEADYRFLHLSAHGDHLFGQHIEFANGARVDCEAIEKFLEEEEGYTLEGQFLTLSVCGHISFDFVDCLHELTEVTAVVHPCSIVEFEDAALFYFHFYYCLFKHPHLRTRNGEIRENISDQRILPIYIDAFKRAQAAHQISGARGSFRLVFWVREEKTVIF